MSFMEGVSGMSRWLVSLGKKFLRVTPGATMVVVLATLVSQLAVLLAFFLPLKVVILLGTDGMPRYFPEAFSEIDRDSLIVILSCATVVFYVLHLLAERIIALGTDRGTRQLLQRSQKLVLFDNQDEVAAWGYQRYSDAMAGAAFVGISLILLCYLYRGMAGVLIGYAALSTIGILAVYRGHAAGRRLLKERLGSVLSIVWSTGFLLAFVYLVVDFVYLAPPDLIAAIVALLLARQISTRIVGTVMAIRGLGQQRLKLDALFFHGKVLAPRLDSMEEGLWPLLDPCQIGSWLGPLLEQSSGHRPESVSWRWWQTGEQDVVALFVKADTERWLVKLFDDRRMSLAKNEASILADAPAGLPALPISSLTQVDRFQCHVSRLPTGEMVGHVGIREVADRIRTRLMSVVPSEQLERRYKRSRPSLWHHLDDRLVGRLRVVADDSLIKLLEKFSSRLEHIRNHMEALPVGLVHPNLNPDTVFRTDCDEELLVHWFRWSLEPVGAGWPVLRLPRLKAALDEASESRGELVRVNVEQVETAALIFALVKAFRRQRYVDALELIPEILEREG